MMSEANSLTFAERTPIGGKGGLAPLLKNFDEVINREGTGALKYDYARYGIEKGVIPMWVADMEFRAPEEVNKALADMAAHGIYGYTDNLPGYQEAVLNWYRRRFCWEALDPSWCVKTPGVVFAIAVAVDAYTRKGENVLIQEPVYAPFSHVPKEKGRGVLINELINDSGRYRVDFEDFEKKAARSKLFLLCSPHNPVGRVFTREELERMGEICLRHGVTIFADEIHSDFVYAPHKHIILADISKELAGITVTGTAPSKTFNLAGLQVSHNFIADKEKRKLFQSAYAASGYSQLNTAGLAACRAAYLYGEAWLTALLEYLKGNIALVRDKLKSSPIKLTEPEGTYLLWLDCRTLNIEGSVKDYFLKKGVWLHDGAVFGAGGQGFARMNIACPSSTLAKATLAIASLEGA